MIILAIGDIHGEDFFLEILKSYKYRKIDKIIFLGDYMDSFYLQSVLIKRSLLDILELKEKEPDKYVLLLGNHDVQYLKPTVQHECSGYRKKDHNEFYNLFNKYKTYFDVAYQINNYIFTHAGVHEGWYNYVFLPEVAKMLPELSYRGNVATKLNVAYKTGIIPSIYDCGYDRGGNKQLGGPLWVDKSKLWRKPLKGYHQIVGHTKINLPVVRELSHKYAEETSITFIDTGDKHASYKLEVHEQYKNNK